MNASPTNVTELLVVALAVAALFMLLRKKYDSNLPLLFYFVALVFANMFDRPVNPVIMYGGLGFCLLLRFEFMGGAIAKLVGLGALSGLIAIIVSMMSDVLA